GQKFGSMPAVSGEVAALQRRIGLVDDLEPLLGRLVAAMRIGVVQLDQFLVPRLEANEREGRLELEHQKRDRLGARRSLVPLPRPSLARRSRLAGAITKDAEIIANRRSSRPVATAERPSRTLPNGVVADLRLDLPFAHAGIVIPCRIVFTNVLEA